MPTHNFYAGSGKSKGAKGRKKAKAKGGMAYGPGGKTNKGKKSGGMYKSKKKVI